MGIETLDIRRAVADRTREVAACSGLPVGMKLTGRTLLPPRGGSCSLLRTAGGNETEYRKAFNTFNNEFVRVAACSGLPVGIRNESPVEPAGGRFGRCSLLRVAGGGMKHWVPAQSFQIRLPELQPAPDCRWE